MLGADAIIPNTELSNPPPTPVQSGKPLACQLNCAVTGIIYQYQLAADGSDHFPYIGQPITHHFGYSVAQVMENPQLLWSTVLAEDRADVEAAVQDSAMHLTPFAVEYRAHNRLGEVRWYAARSVPERQTDGSILWSGMILDINNRKLAEIDCLKAIQDLKQLNTQFEHCSVANLLELKELVDWLYSEMQRQGTAPPSQTTRATATLLLAEDNTENIDIFSTYLDAAGYRVLAARTGIEAVALSKSHNPDLILMDLHMPDLDGLDAIRQIHTEPGLQKIPILTLTARAMPGDREQCFAVGANEYLSKPIRLKYLMERVEYWLEKTNGRRL